MNELGPSKISMILGTQYFFALLREDEETLHAVAKQVDELSKRDVNFIIKAFKAVWKELKII